MATFNIDIGTDYIEVWLTGLQENYAYIREYDLRVYEYNDQNTPIGLDSDSDHNLDEDNQSESPHLIVTGLEPDTHYYYEFLCYNTSQGTFVSEEDDFWTDEETSSGGGSDDNDTTYEWYEMSDTIYSNSFELDYVIYDYEIGWVRFTPTTDGTVTIYTEGDYDNYGYLALYDKTSIDSDGYVTGALEENDDSGTDNNFKIIYDVEADVDYEIDIHELSHSKEIEGTLYVEFESNNYTITYNLGNGTGWSVQNVALSQTTSAGGSISLWTSNDLLAYRNSSFSTGNTITFNANGGTTTKSSATSTYYTDYTHTKWNTKKTGVGTSYAFGATYTPTADITLYPYFTSSYRYSNVTLPTTTECTRDGYTLLGWSNSSTATEMSYAPGAQYSGAETTTLYAVWKQNTYTVSIPSVNHVTTTGAGSYVAGNTVTVAAAPATGYGFVKWSASNGNTSTSSTYTFKMPEENLTLTPSVAPIEYTIILNFNNGQPNAVSYYTIETATQTISAQTRDGYDFLGWTGSNGTSPQQTITIAKGSTGNKSYTANWRQNTFQFTLGSASNVSTAGSTSSGQIKAGSAVTLEANPSEGYSFNQWTSSNTSLVSNTTTASTSFLMPYGDITMTPSVTANSYTYTIIQKSTSGKVLAQDNYTQKFGSTLSLTLSPHTGYQESTRNLSIPWNTASNKTLTYTYTPITYTITIDCNGGSGVSNNTYNIESSAITLGTPSRTGYTFTGWTGSNGTTAQKTVTISSGSYGNKSYTANWTPTNYTITYNLNNGTQANGAITNYNIESNTFTLPIPTRTNYAFVGWYDNSSFTGNRITQIAKGNYGNKIYYAKWVILQTSYFTNVNYTINGASQYLKDLTVPNGIAINWYAETTQMQNFINKINKYCGTTITLNEKQLLSDYNLIVDALNNSSNPDHLSGATKPSLQKKTVDDYISRDDLIALEEAFNNRKFI